MENGKVDRSHQSVEIISIDKEGHFCKGFRHTAEDAGIIWTTTIVYNAQDGDHWIGIRTDRHSIDPLIRIRDAKKPQIVRNILRDIGGGLDGEVFVRDTPLMLKENDLSMAARLINGDSDNYLPVVYISQPFDENLSLDVSALARALGGLAHVIVEPSRQFSRQLQAETSSRNPYGGAVGIHLPTGQRWLFLPPQEELELRFEIVAFVRSILANRRPLARCSWDNLEAEKSRDEIERLKAVESTDLDAFVKAFDQENRALKATLSASDAEISRLKEELNTINLRAKSQGQKGIGSVGIQDYFSGEGDAVIRDALESALGNTVAGSRREEILTQAISEIPESTEHKKRKDELKEALRGSRGLEGDVIDTLRRLGFSIESSGKHHKLIYNGDDKFVFAMAKTAGDHRAGLNLASDISKKIY